MRRKLIPFLTFMAWLAVVGVGSTSRDFGKTADSVTLFILLGVLALLSISVVREKLSGCPSAKKRDSLFRRYLRWMTDDYKTLS